MSKKKKQVAACMPGLKLPWEIDPDSDKEAYAVFLNDWKFSVFQVGTEKFPVWTWELTNGDSSLDRWTKLEVDKPYYAEYPLVAMSHCEETLKSLMGVLGLLKQKET